MTDKPDWTLTSADALCALTAIDAIVNDSQPNYYENHEARWLFEKLPSKLHESLVLGGREVDEHGCRIGLGLLRELCAKHRELDFVEKEAIAHLKRTLRQFTADALVSQLIGTAEHAAEPGDVCSVKLSNGWTVMTDVEARLRQAMLGGVVCAQVTP